MTCRILVTGAGTGASENLIRSLRAADATIDVVGCHDDRFVLQKSSAERRYLMPSATEPRFGAALLRIVEAEDIRLVIPTSDVTVSAVSELRGALGARCFLPGSEAIRLCQDKHDLAAHLRAHGVPAPETHAVTDIEGLDALFERLGWRTPLWCRARSGCRSLAAAPVASPEQARAWIRHWEVQRGLPAQAFTLCEYLPGPDFLCQSLWRDGALILANTFERLSYFGGENSPSGTSSLSSLAKTVVDPRLVAICRQAILAVSPRASGAFSVDLKEDRSGTPCITEINAGRFFIGMTAFDHVLKHNMPGTFLRLALGEPVELTDAYDAVDGYYLVRDLDTLPGVFHADELFDGIVTVDA